MRAVKAGTLLLIALSPLACGKKVTRIDPNSVTDLSGRWNDTDSRLVANELITQTISSQWATRYSETHGGQTPTVLVGQFRNETLEHIPVGTFLNDLERALINTGAVRVVASNAERAEIREERKDQQQNASADSRAKMAQELGAKYILQGSLQAIEDAEGREKIVYYQVDATLIDIESNVKVWTGQKKIKKYIERPRVRM